MYARCYIEDPFHIVRANHEYLNLLLVGNIESLVVDAFEAVLNDCISLLLNLKDMLVQFDVLRTHSLTIDYDIARNSLCGIVYHMLLIDKTIHHGSETHEHLDTMSVVFILEDGFRQLHVKVEER